MRYPKYPLSLGTWILDISTGHMSMRVACLQSQSLPFHGWDIHVSPNLGIHIYQLDHFLSRYFLSFKQNTSHVEPGRMSSSNQTLISTHYPCALQMSYDLFFSGCWYWSDSTGYFQLCKFALKLLPQSNHHFRWQYTPAALENCCCSRFSSILRTSENLLMGITPLRGFHVYWSTIFFWFGVLLNYVLWNQKSAMAWKLKEESRSLVF